jgi:hypothetical protein
MPTFTSPFTGTVVQPTDVSYYQLNFSANTNLVWPSLATQGEIPAARIIDCVATTTGLNINLPPGSQGAVGTDILFRNLGSNTFVVRNFSGGASVTVAPGISKYFYLTDNSTDAGIWANVTFAAGTSFADAASLQGAGLTTVEGKLATSQNIIEVSSSPTIADNDRASTYVWIGGNSSLTLPLASSLTDGWFIGFRNSGTGALSIATQTTSLINGLTDVSTNPGDSGFVFFQGSTGNFYTVGLATPSNVTFTSATYDVDAIGGSTLNLVSYAPIIQNYVALSGSRTTTLNVVFPATTQLYILTNNTADSGYNISFNVSGSVTPAIVLAEGEVATVLSDGNTLYALTQTSTSTFFASDGTASAPSYSFANDTSTGMYLNGVSVLGLTVNSTNLLNLDNTNVLDPIVSVNARLKADLINGGTF